MIMVIQSIRSPHCRVPRSMSRHSPPVGSRVVITGLGAVTPLGLSVADFWNHLLAGNSGAAPITSFDASSWSTTFACEVKGFDPANHMERKLARRLDPYAQYAVAAAEEAL